MSVHCEIVEVRNLADAVGLACPGTATNQCSSCGAELCEYHAETCDMCRAVALCFVSRVCPCTKRSTRSQPRRIMVRTENERAPKQGNSLFPISAAIPLRIRTKNSTAPLTSSTNSIRKSGFINSSLRIVTTPGLLSGKMKCKTSIYFSYYFLSEELRNTIRYCPQREQHFGRRYGTSSMHTNLCNFDLFRGRVVYKTGSSLPMREHCEIVEMRNSADAVGYSCSRTASTQCSDCGTELCESHTESCSACHSVFCPSC